MITDTRQDVREFEVYEFQILQIMPADKPYLAVYANRDRTVFVLPVMAWAMCDERCQHRIRYAVNGRIHAENDGEVIVTRKVVPLTLHYDDGELKPPNAASNFLGVCKADEDLEDIFSEDLDRYVREGAVR